jgi:hypothetical protein
MSAPDAVDGCSAGTRVAFSPGKAVEIRAAGIELP